jgi:hypothetical protein
MLPKSWRPPQPPEPLLRKSCVVIAPNAAGYWFGWNYVWGEYDGNDPVYFGPTRAAVNRTLQNMQFEVPVWVAQE